jgi:hypothetical protein
MLCCMQDAGHREREGANNPGTGKPTAQHKQDQLPKGAHSPQGCVQCDA